LPEVLDVRLSKIKLEEEKGTVGINMESNIFGDQILIIMRDISV
jgi:hypothetical protein